MQFSTAIFSEHGATLPKIGGLKIELVTQSCSLGACCVDICH